MGYGENMNKMALIAGIIVAVVVVAAVGYFVLSGDDGDSGDSNPGDAVSATINGSDYTYTEMEDEFGTKTVSDKEGVSLSAIVNGTDLANPGTDAYVLKAEDGYAMAVNWTVMQSGIVTLVEEMDDGGNETAYLMTVFPNLPSAYKIKYLADIEPKTDLVSIACNGLEYYLDYMPKKVGEKTVVYNDTYSATGWSLSDMVNYTSLSNPASHNFTIVGYDATDDEPWYNKTVTWDGMMDGVIIEENTKTVFGVSTGFAKKSYMVKFVIEIIVE
jgi:hypothetical protein